MSTVGKPLELGMADENVVQTIAVFFAMAAEAAPLIDHLQLTKLEKPPFPKGSPWTVYSGSHNGINVHAAVPGKDKYLGVDNVGTVPSALMAYAVGEKFKPDLILNAGTAGGFQAKGAKIGDVYLATHFANHDRRIPIPGFDKYGIGELESHPTPNLLKELNLKEGKVSTGNSLDMTEEDRKAMEDNGASIKDMESAAVAWVGHILDIPVISIKSVTDIVDGGRPTSEEFLENLHAASVSLQKVVPLVVSFVGGKKLADL